MSHIDDLLTEAAKYHVQVVEHSFQTTRLKGLYCDNVITINKSASLTTVEKACVIAEELGHHFTTNGTILDQSRLENRKQERRARQWAYEHLLPLHRLVEAFKDRITGRHELAEYLGVSEQFLQDSINRYKDIYGIFSVVQDRYVVYFDPLSIGEFFIKLE
jgi:Zn-dependent peptidase ImmA (M78 family)